MSYPQNPGGPYGQPPQQGWGPPPGAPGAPNPYQAPHAQQVGFQQGQMAAEIAKQANAALLWGIVGLFCFGFVLGPAAIIRGSIAKKKIAESGIGHEHATKATIGQVLGALAFVGWIGGLIFRLSAL